MALIKERREQQHKYNHTYKHIQGRWERIGRYNNGMGEDREIQ